MTGANVLLRSFIFRVSNMKKKHKNAKGFSFYKSRAGYKKFNRKKIIRAVLDWGIVIFAAAVLGYAFVMFGIQTVHVNGPSMEGTLYHDDVVLLNKMIYHFQDVERYDIVAIKKMDNSGYYDIKRVIGLPGETIQIVGGKLVIDGMVLEDVPFDDYIMTAGLASSPVTLSQNEYFVIGDNVNNSEDSRYTNFGNIMKSEIKGKVFYRIRPSDTKGKVN